MWQLSISDEQELGPFLRVRSTVSVRSTRVVAVLAVCLVSQVSQVSQRKNLKPLSAFYRSPVTRKFPKFISRSFHKAFTVTENTNSAALEANQCGKLSPAMV